MRINEEKLIEEIKRLQRDQFRIKSLTDYIQTELDIETVIDIYERTTGKSLKIKKIENSYYKSMDKDNIFAYSLIPISLYFQSQRECTLFSTKMLDAYEEEGYYDALMVNALRTLNEKEVLEILREFLSAYDERLLMIFNESYSHNLIDLGNEKTYDTFFTRTKFLEDESFVLVGGDITLYSIETICHELGHVRTFKEFHRRCKKQLYYDQISYFEMYSTFLEFVFIDYLKKNHILMRDTIIMENEVYASAYAFLQDLEQSSHFTSEESDLEILNYIKNGYIYSYAFIIALLLHERYLESPDEVKQILDNYIFSAGLILKDEQLQILDITKDDIMDTKVLRKRLQTHNLDLRKYVLK